MACKDKRTPSTSNAVNGNDIRIVRVVDSVDSAPNQANSTEFLTETLNHLLAVLLSSKEGLTPKQILYDYIYLVGEPLPYQELGYPDLVSMLNAHPNVCERFIENGQMLYRPILNHKCEHIRRLVEGQRTESRKLRTRKRKSISITDEEHFAPKRSKSEPRKDPVANGDKAESAPIAPPLIEIKTTPTDKNKSVHFVDLIPQAANRRPQQRQRSRTRLPFFHKDDPNKPKFRGFRRRGKSTSALPAGVGMTDVRAAVKPADEKPSGSRDSGPLDVVSSSNPKRFSRLGNPPMVTSTPRRSVTEIPQANDIRNDIISVLDDHPKGVLVHEIPALFKAKIKRDIPVFLSASKSMIEFFSMMSNDFCVINQPLGTVRIKLRKFDREPSAAEVLPPATAAAGCSQSAKSRVVETLLTILGRHSSRGIFLSRLRVEYKRATGGDVIPYKRLGFVSERLFFASMPENFNLRTMNTDPGVIPEYIISCAAPASASGTSALQAILNPPVTVDLTGHSDTASRAS